MAATKKQSLKTFSLAFFLLICISGSAQRITIASWTGSFLYKGLTNYIQIGLPGIAADSIIVTATHSQVRKTDNWSWTINPDTAFAFETITVTALKKKKIVAVDSSKFRLKWSPDPKIILLNTSSSSDTISKNELNNAFVFNAIAVDVPVDLLYKVVFFGMHIEPDSAMYLSDTQFLTQLQRYKISQMKSGNRVVFNGFVVKYPDGRILRINTTISYVLE